jgi:hypothetical protein
VGKQGDNASVSTSGGVDESRGQPASCFNFTGKLEVDMRLREKDVLAVAAVASSAAPALHP